MSYPILTRYISQAFPLVICFCISSSFNQPSSEQLKDTIYQQLNQPFALTESHLRLAFHLVLSLRSGLKSLTDIVRVDGEMAMLDYEKSQHMRPNQIILVSPYPHSSSRSIITIRTVKMSPK